MSTTQAELKDFIDSVVNYDFFLGIHDLLYSKNFTFTESYDPDGHVYNRTAILMRGLCHVCYQRGSEITITLGRLPWVAEEGLLDIPSIVDTLESLYADALDEWQELDQEDDPTYVDFTAFTWTSLINAVEGKEVAPVLTFFLKVFRADINSILQYVDSYGGGDMEGEPLTDQTLVQALTAFVEFVRDVVLPKIAIKEDDQL